MRRSTRRRRLKLGERREKRRRLSKSFCPAGEEGRYKAQRKGGRIVLADTPSRNLWGEKGKEMVLFSLPSN